MDSKWFALGIPAASGAVLLFAIAVSSSATTAPQTTEASLASDESGYCPEASVAAPVEAELCSATVTPPAESEVEACPVTGARGKSTLHFEEVMGRVHRGLGVCPHAEASETASACPHLRENGEAPAEASTRRPQGTWL
jgi:hypothetical protein